MNDHITITWCIDDVKTIDSELTDNQCVEVLRLAKCKHDANVGINWDVLNCYVDLVKN